MTLSLSNKIVFHCYHIIIPAAITLQNYNDTNNSEYRKRKKTLSCVILRIITSDTIEFLYYTIVIRRKLIIKLLVKLANLEKIAKRCNIKCPICTMMTTGTKVFDWYPDN